MTLEEALTAAKKTLSDAAKTYSASGLLADDVRKAAWGALCASAEAFAKAQWALKAPPRSSTSSGKVIPFGRSKGTPLHEAEKKDLEWFASILPESIADPAKAKYSGQNQELLDAVLAELGTR